MLGSEARLGYTVVRAVVNVTGLAGFFTG